MADDFDPYHEWLGIPKADRPPDHYRLLGLTKFEANRQVISQAYDQRMTHIQSMQSGPHATYTQPMLSELSRAFTCLLNSRRKALYDQHLRIENNTAQIAAARQPPSNVELIPPIETRSSASAPESKGMARTLGQRHAAERMRQKIRTWSLVFGMFALSTTLLAMTFKFLSPNVSRTHDPSIQKELASSDLAGTTTINKRGNSSDTDSFSGTELNQANSTDQSKSLSEIPNPSTNDDAAEKLASTDNPQSSGNSNAATAPPAAPKETKQLPAADSVAETARGTAVAPRYALHFEGNGHIELATTSGLIDIRRPFTVEMWVRFSAGADVHWLTGDMVFGPNHPEVSGNNPAGWQLWIMSTAGSKHRIAAATGKGFYGEFLERENGWRHLAICGDADQIAVFVDGRRAQSQPIELFSENSKSSPIPLHIGGHSYLHPTQPVALRGDIKAYRVSLACRYRDNFPPSELLELDSDTAVWLNFSQKNEMLVNDLSGFARHGSIVNAKWIELLEQSPPAAPPTTTVVANAIPALPVRQPVPSESEIARARDAIVEVFKADKAKATDDKQRDALARKLRTLAQENSENLAHQFVLFDEARLLAAAAGNIHLANEIVDDAVRYFEKDEWKWKVETIRKTAELVKSPDSRRRIVTAVLDQVDQIVQQGNFEVASHFIQVASGLAGRARDVESVRQAKHRREELTSQKNRWVQAHESKKGLDEFPDDPKRNEDWGLFLAVQQEDWNTALPYLARASTKEIQSAASFDVQRPAQIEQQVLVGNLWFDAAHVAEKRDRQALLDRALQWYRRAEPAAKGLSRVQVEKRIQELTLVASLETKKVGRSKKGPTLPESIDIPPGLRGLLGRIQVDGRDAGVLWRYESGLAFHDATVNDILSRVGVPPGKLHMEFVGVVFVPESARVGVRMIGGSTTTGSGALYVDGKKQVDVGADKDARDQTVTISLSPGEHAVRWILLGTEVGRSSLNFIDTRSAKPLSVYHTPQIALIARDQPFRAKLNVDMTRSP